MAKAGGGAPIAAHFSDALRYPKNRCFWAESWGNDNLFQFAAKCLWRKNR